MHASSVGMYIQLSVLSRQFVRVVCVSFPVRIWAGSLSLVKSLNSDLPHSFQANTRIAGVLKLPESFEMHYSLSSIQAYMVLLLTVALHNLPLDK
jgi:hypothetical protein